MKTVWRPVAAMLLFGACALGTGCTKSEPAQFRLNMEGVDRNQFRLVGGESESEAAAKKEAIKGRQDLATALYAMFGTPDEPYAFPESGLDLRQLQLAAGPVSSDEEGTHVGLYRQHCVHCHGVSGGGDGPTALFLNPYPRDYRRGIFKFTSTGPGARPTSADLKRVIMDGVPGTAMPAFSLLPEDEVDALVEYVKYLAIRGEVELSLMYYIEQEEEVPLDRDMLAAELMAVVDTWNDAESKVVEPDQDLLPPQSTSEELAASIARGREIFRDAKNAQCITCHGPTGLGDGGQELYDDWNKDKTAENIAEWSLPKQPLDPRNLRLGIYRGGRRPVDLYRRIYAGIKGTPMPAAGQVLEPQQIWDLVNYVRSLPYDEATQELTSHQEHAGVDRPRL